MAEQIIREIWLFQRRRTPPIDIAEGSQLPIALKLMDYTIPTEAMAKAYSRPWGRETAYTQAATVSDNAVVFTPQDGFFSVGGNSLQVEISGNKIPLIIDVNCGSRLSNGGDGATPEAVRPLVARAEDAAKAAESSKAQAQSSASAALASQKAAATSEANAVASASTASSAANASKKSETNATGSAAAAAASASAALASQKAAATSEANAASSATAAAASQTAATSSEKNAASSAAAAKKAETAAKESAGTVTAAAEKITANEKAINALITRLKSGAIADAELHLGFYLDENGDLCQKED